MARRRKREEHDNHDRWLISYADFITLLFAFFVVLYAISSVNEGKYKTFVDSINTAFNASPVSAVVGAETDRQLLQTVLEKRQLRAAEMQRKTQEEMRNLALSLSHVLAPLMQQGLVNINQTQRGVTIDVSASLLFRTAEADLQPDKLTVLESIALALSKEVFAIEIEGHTDDVPIATALYPSNWELSAARASSVARFLIAHQVSAFRITVIGLADTKPVAANDTIENRSKNRRVAITIVAPDSAR